MTNNELASTLIMLGAKEQKSTTGNCIDYKFNNIQVTNFINESQYPNTWGFSLQNNDISPKQTLDLVLENLINEN